MCFKELRKGTRYVHIGRIKIKARKQRRLEPIDREGIQPTCDKN